MSMDESSSVIYPSRISKPVYGWAQQTPEAPAVYDRGKTTTYAELKDLMCDLKVHLEGMGVRPGDRLLIVAENCLETLALVLASSEMDVWPIPINARLSQREVETIREHCDARVVFFTAEVSKAAKEHASHYNAKQFDFEPLSELLVSDIFEDAVPEKVYEENDKQVGAMIYTSGTTGHPKGVMLSHKSLSYVAIISGRIRGLTRDDKSYAVLPISHSFGLTSTSLGTLYAGGCIYMVAFFNPEHILNAFENDGVTVFQGVPPMYAKILEHLEETGREFKAPKLSYLSSGGAPLDLNLKNKVQDTFGVQLNNGYGLTETAPTLCQTRIEEPRDSTSIGSLLPGMEVRFTDKNGEPVSSDVGGTLWVRGPNIMLGYYKEPAMTAEVIDEEGWFNTGDLARTDELGDLNIIGRAKEVIIRSGFNVYPEEVEAVMMKHADVTLAGVVGRNIEGNEEVIGFVQLRPGASVTEEELRSYLKDNLAPYKIPCQLRILEELPASSTGKIRKDVLRKLAA